MTLRLLEESDFDPIRAALREQGWSVRDGLYEQYLAEQTAGFRQTWIADQGGALAGYLNILWRSGYAPFAEADIPEIADFNVWPGFRRRGIGSALMDRAEERIATRSPIAGIGVGMTADYGAAQQLYVRRGYVPDGRGLMSAGQPVVYGASVPVDDALVLYFTRTLHP